MKTAVRYALVPLVGYGIYALIAVFTTLTLLPNTALEIGVLAVLVALAVLGQAMDDGARRAARRGDATAKNYMRQHHLGDDDPWIPGQ